MEYGETTPPTQVLSTYKSDDTPWLMKRILVLAVLKVYINDLTLTF